MTELLLGLLLLLLAGGDVDEPVWRQLLRLQLDNPDPGVARQEARALVVPL
jgi:hypothetical protein